MSHVSICPDFVDPAAYVFVRNVRRAVVVPPDPDKATGSASKEMNISGSKFWGVKKELLLYSLKNFNYFALVT
jgi:hypothetical protein